MATQPFSLDLRSFYLYSADVNSLKHPWNNNVPVWKLERPAGDSISLPATTLRGNRTDQPANLHTKATVKPFI
ncbi:hypothetical protein K0M31_002758, partial [Melipona bicolor]